MIKYLYPDGTPCYRALHTAHAVLYAQDGTLTAGAQKPDCTGLYEFESVGFELLQPGIRYA
jgi:hypothetical protein